MRSENLEFREALELLAERAGINIQPRNTLMASRVHPQILRPGHEKRTLYRVAAWRGPVSPLPSRIPEAEPAAFYLAERGLTPDTITRFNSASPPTAGTGF